MSEEKKTQWHPPFYAGMRLELRENREDLEFQNEVTLNTKPIQLDLLIIKKRAGAVIRSELGRIFRGYNVFEYKSPEDTLGVNEYFKTVAYASLYKTASGGQGKVRADDITLSLVREGAPRDLLKWEENSGGRVEEAFPGVYYIYGEQIIFPTQVIVSSKLTDDGHEWLKSLTSHLTENAGERLLTSARELTDKREQDDADAVLQLAISENKALFEKLKEVPEMKNQALMELMRPELEEERKEGRAEGRAEMVKKAISLGNSVQQISLLLGLSEDEVRKLSKA